MLARAFGARTFKLKFGHRGANHPVKDLQTGRIYITSQNHGYAVDPDGLSDDLDVWQVHLNDGTCEGLRHRREPVLSIQYHSEASPGPLDNVYVFDRFLEIVEEFRTGVAANRVAVGLSSRPVRRSESGDLETWMVSQRGDELLSRGAEVTRFCRPFLRQDQAGLTEEKKSRIDQQDSRHKSFSLWM